MCIRDRNSAQLDQPGLLYLEREGRNAKNCALLYWGCGAHACINEGVRAGGSRSSGGAHHVTDSGVRLDGGPDTALEIRGSRKCCAPNIAGVIFSV